MQCNIKKEFWFSFPFYETVIWRLKIFAFGEELNKMIFV